MIMTIPPLRLRFELSQRINLIFIKDYFIIIIAQKMSFKH